MHPRGPQTDLAAFLEPFGTLVRRAESREALEHYVTGLISHIQRKTASEIARAIPAAGSQRLQEFLTRTAWDPTEMSAMRTREMVAHATTAGGVLVVGSTAFSKKGVHSVGVERQPPLPGRREENCQVLVTAHYADDVFDWPVCGRLYLPESWAGSAERRAVAHIPADVTCESRAGVALRLVDQTRAAGIPARAVSAEPELGDEPEFVAGLAARGVPYVVELSSLDGIVEDAAAGDGWERLASRRDGGAPRVREYRRRRARLALPDGREMQGWLLRERAVSGHRAPERSWFSAGLDAVPLAALVHAAGAGASLRAFHERARRDLGLADYEGRLWSGFHRHVALVMLADSYRLLLGAYGPLDAPPPPRRRRRRRRAGQGAPPATAP
jgi:SRSO17 transposase